MQFTIAAMGHLVEILRIDARKAESAAHGRPLESDVTKFGEAGFGAREPFGFKPIARELLVAR